MSDAFKPRYGSQTASLWTPFQTGAFPLSTQPIFQLDADYTASFVTGAGNYLTSATDNIGDIEFGPRDAADFRTFPIYATQSMDAYIGNRPTIWFWEESVRSGPNTALTASVADFSSINFPADNDDRSVFFVLKVNSTRIFAPDPNEVWQYGVDLTNKAWGFGLRQTGTVENLPPSSDFRTSETASAELLRGGGFTQFFSGSGELITQSPTGAFGAVADIWYMFHSSSSTGSVQRNGGSDQYLYSASLDTMTSSLGANAPGIVIGDGINAGYNGDYVIGEMLILDGVPTEQDQQRIEGYLAWKWDLTGSLPVSHPFFDTQPTNNDGVLSFTFAESNVAPQITSTTGTFKVNREGGFGALTATIQFTGTAVSGTDYLVDFPYPLELSWSQGQTGSKEFSVTFLENAPTTKTFEPFFSGTGNAISETPTSSITTIIYPGIFNFDSPQSASITEGGNTVITINRTEGTFGDITASLMYTGALDPMHDFSVNGITFADVGGEFVATASFANGENSFSFALTASDDIDDESAESGSFDLTFLNYPLSSSIFYPSGVVGQSHEFVITVLDNESGSLKINNPDGHYIYTASMPVTWSIERIDAADGAASATVDLVASGGFGRAVFGIDYSSTSGSFPYTFNWDDQESQTQTFSIQTLTNSELTGVSISPVITNTSSSFGTPLTGSPASQPAWIVHPGELYMTELDDDVVEGASFVVQLARRSGKVGHLTGTMTFGGTAVSGADYSPVSSVDDPPVPPEYFLAVPDGDTSTIFSVDTEDDVVDEDNETITISINNDSGTIYHFSASDGTIYTNYSDYAFNTASLISTNPSFITSSTISIIDNETGTINFASEFTGTIYVTGTQTLVYSVERTIAGDFATTATIALSSSTTAIQGLDFDGISFPHTLTWADQVTGSKTFTVNFLNNSERTGTLFVPFIQASTTASIGTASFSTTQIVHPGIVSYSELTASVVEGATKTITVTRSSGSDGHITGNLFYGGDATRNTDYTAPDTFVLGDGESSTTFNVVTVDDIIEDGQSESATITIRTLGYSLTDSLYNPTASINSVRDVFTLTITDNETGSLNFSTVSSSLKQPGSGTPNTLTITVERSGGVDFAAEATITQVGGTATTADYSGLPATLNWSDQDGDDKSFTITAINTWGNTGKTLQMGFTTLSNVSTGTNVPNQEITFTNTIFEEQNNQFDEIASDFTINRFKNMRFGYKRKIDAVPFSRGSEGVSTTVRDRETAYSASL
jgi:hypothetical protein